MTVRGGFIEPPFPVVAGKRKEGREVGLGHDRDDSIIFDFDRLEDEAREGVPLFRRRGVPRDRPVAQEGRRPLNAA